ncbi:hypothetical protein GW932_05035 [archaeon]|nr:hypothetical protein [archaeon]
MINLKAFIFGVAVFILTLFVTVYGVNSIYSKPIYEDFCPNSIMEVNVMNESVCFENGGKWTPYQTFKACEAGEVCGSCDVDYSCREAYDLASERYSMNLFLISIPLGILILFFGFYFFKVDFVSVGLMAGGVGTLLRGIGTYWKYSEDWIRFLISLFGLLVILYFSYRFQGRIQDNKHIKRK